ncbi:transmembrane protein 14C-like protein [Entophlyctis helioformis]|nr:transmembrane protein 14C-like protein [Entophlyctis helioformis]
MKVDKFAFIYAALVFLGGLIGFIKAGSAASLMMGTLFGGLAFIGARQVSTNPSNYFLILAVGGILMLIMGSRFANSGKFMPAGFVSLLSAAIFVRYGIRLLQ